uniref:HDC15518 n=1 Tax=Drosophila melanogaster TaxID=7227 RepID=Q6IJA1_DROME|nr:TPA_inf: HDC15518 [Drosophila melanogaster]
MRSSSFIVQSTTPLHSTPLHSTPVQSSPVHIHATGRNTKHHTEFNLISIQRFSFSSRASGIGNRASGISGLPGGQIIYPAPYPVRSIIIPGTFRPLCHE